MVITGKENLTSYQTTPTVIRYFCKTCSNRVYGVKLDDDGNEQQYVRLHPIEVLLCAVRLAAVARSIVHMDAARGRGFWRHMCRFCLLASLGGSRGRLRSSLRRQTSSTSSGEALLFRSAHNAGRACATLTVADPEPPVCAGPRTCMTTSRSGAHDLRRLIGLQASRPWLIASRVCCRTGQPEQSERMN